MKRYYIITALLLLSLAPLRADYLSIETPNTRLLLQANKGGGLKMLYYGDLSATDSDIINSGTQGFDVLPAFGTIDMIYLPALQVQHADGDLNLTLRVTDWLSSQDDDYKLLRINLADKVERFEVSVFFKASKKTDVIQTWTEIVHHEKKPVTLKRFDSGHLFFEDSEPWLLHFHGDWAAEAIPTVERLIAGTKIISNTDGARNSHLDAPEVMLCLDGEPKENSGRTIGAALCWSGNFEIRINTDNNRNTHLYAGINPQGSEYVLQAGKIFQTPTLAFSFSHDGMGGVSRNFHRWARACGMVHNGLKTRDILLNSWEGIYFDITEQRIINMIDDISTMGGELFVMDDGWFGNKYQRNTDNAALGDWVVDKRKLPNGLSSLTAAAKERNIKFGIWIEPEMVNTTSELFEQHPEWALQVKNRDLKLGRGGTQLVLDLTNPKVQDYVFSIVDNLLTVNPEIAYIKWDANSSIQNYGSTYLPADQQNNISIDYHLGLQKTLERIRAKYPDVVIQNCASGGGRANYGLMPYFDEFWVSDNNDALQRIYIQWGTSFFFPSNTMAQHIGGSPYHMTGRNLPIKFRCDVAMSGRLGMELQPSNMTDAERKQCSTAIEDYKSLRETIQLGNLYRLVSPYDQTSMPAYQQVAALMYVNDDCSQAVVFAYGMSDFMRQKTNRIRLAGLDPERTYTIMEKNVKNGEEACSLNEKSFSGTFLMTTGIKIPLSADYSTDYQSRVFLLYAE